MWRQVQCLFYYHFIFIIILCSKDQQEAIVHDVQAAVKKIHDWKAHLMRTAHQEAAKSTILNEMAPSQVLIIMDWAMKFLPVRFRETQSEWFGKKGRPWHVSAAIAKGAEEELEVYTSSLKIISNSI